MLFGASDRKTDAHVKTGRTETFQQDVLETSAEKPVIVEFHDGEGCGLEPVVARLEGKAALVRMDARKEKALADQLRLQSFPSVVAFVDGHFAAGFSGRPGDVEVTAFVSELTGGGGADADADALLEAAKAAFDAGDLAGAAQAFATVIQARPNDPEAVAGLARCQLASGHSARAKDVLAMLSETQTKHPAVLSVQASLTLAEEAADAGDPDDVARRLASSPDDPELLFEAARSDLRQGRMTSAVEKALDSVAADREWRDGAARRLTLQIFDALGPSAPETIAGRRRLSSILFA